MGGNEHSGAGEADPGAARPPAPDLGKLRVEARARVMWGEPREDVVRFLVDAGVADVAAQAIVGEMLSERGSAFRRQGLIEMIMGLPLVFFGAMAVLGVEASPLHASRDIKAVALAALIAGVGGLLTTHGLVRIFSGGRGGGAASNLNFDWVVEVYDSLRDMVRR